MLEDFTMQRSKLENTWIFEIKFPEFGIGITANLKGEPIILKAIANAGSRSSAAGTTAAPAGCSSAASARGSIFKVLNLDEFRIERS